MCSFSHLHHVRLNNFFLKHSKYPFYFWYRLHCIWIKIYPTLYLSDSHPLSVNLAWETTKNTNFVYNLEWETNTHTRKQTWWPIWPWKQFLRVLVRNSQTFHLYFFYTMAIERPEFNRLKLRLKPVKLFLGSKRGGLVRLLLQTTVVPCG